ncbi:hypothetical protein [Clostridium sp. B9]|uniref:hypothetical protein n=1 Tax=Clostridium sp. B9 TaxID=3423224 RepID=UPI003D2ED04C
MNIKKISIIILSILVVGGIIGGAAYKIYAKSSEPQELDIEHIKENSYKDQQTKVQEVDNIKKKTIQEREEYYYKKIKDAKNKQSEYINSFDKTEVKQSLQTSQSAAIGEATLLEIEFP